MKHSGRGLAGQLTTVIVRLVGDFGYWRGKSLCNVKNEGIRVRDEVFIDLS